MLTRRRASLLRSYLLGEPLTCWCPSSRCSLLTMPALALSWCRRWTLATLRTSPELSTPPGGGQQCLQSYSTARTATSCCGRG